MNNGSRRDDSMAFSSKQVRHVARSLIYYLVKAETKSLTIRYNTT